VSGRFIVIEGLDGAGTTTQAALLGARLNAAGLPFAVHKEPTDGPLGRIMRQFTDGEIVLRPETLALGFAGDRLEHSRQIEELVAAGTIVVSDRYVPSSLAYQTAQGVDFEWVRALNSYALEPDVTVFVDTSVAECVARLGARGEFREGPFHRDEYLREARELYLRALASDVPLGRVVTVDGDRPQQDVAAAIWTELEPELT